MPREAVAKVLLALAELPAGTEGAKVRASLVDAKDLLARSFKVTTHRGVVYLMGRVTQREADRAAEVARGVSGVLKVVKVFDIATDRELNERAPRAAPAPAATTS